MPTIRLALISEKVDVDEDHDTYSIGNVFQKKLTFGFPVKEDFAVSVFWNIRGMEVFDQSMLVSDKNGSVMATAHPLRVTLVDPKIVTFTTFRQVVFYIPGMYTVSILVDGERVEKVSFVIEQLNLHA